MSDIKKYEARTIALVPVNSISGLALERVVVIDQYMRTLRLPQYHQQ